MLTHCCLWSITSAWLSLKFLDNLLLRWLQCESSRKRSCRQSQWGPKPWQWGSCKPGAVTTSISPGAHCYYHNQSFPTAITTGERKAFSSQLTASSLIPVTLRSTRMSQVGVSPWHFCISFPPTASPSRSLIFALLRLEDSHEWDWAQGFGYKPKGQTKSTTEVKKRNNFRLLQERMQNLEAEASAVPSKARFWAKYWRK